MPTSTESVCCEEIPQTQEKKECEEVSCITLHPGFASVCLDVWVLQTAYFSLRQEYGSTLLKIGCYPNTPLSHEITGGADVSSWVLSGAGRTLS